MDKSKLTELKLQNLFLLRTFISQVLIILTGGIVGLFFAEHSLAQIIFIVLGILLEVIFIKAYASLNITIGKTLHKEGG